MKLTFVCVFALGLLIARPDALAHPGSGIIVDRQGIVYFIDTGSGLWKIEIDGKLTKVAGPAYHWMSIDLDGRLVKTSLPHFSRSDATVTHAEGNPNILLSSDFPITVGPDGNLYYGWAGDGDRVQIFRLTPSGTSSAVKTLPGETESGPLGWLNGIDMTEDGSIYYTEHRAVRRITPGGEITTVVSNLTLPDCGSVPGVESDVGPYLRGIDVDTQGTVYVAAPGCRAVLKITPDKKVTIVRRTSSPWAPTAVALYGKDLYVLEYLHTPNDNRREWLPRVIKITSDGNAVTVATIDRR